MISTRLESSCLALFCLTSVGPCAHLLHQPQVGSDESSLVVVGMSVELYKGFSDDVEQQAGMDRAENRELATAGSVHHLLELWPDGRQA